MRVTFAQKQGLYYHILEKMIEMNINTIQIKKTAVDVHILKEKIERSFADSKQNHGFRYTMYKGIEKNQNYTWLICVAQNMKNIVTKITKKMKKGPTNSSHIQNFIEKIFLLVQNLVFRKI